MIQLWQTGASSWRLRVSCHGLTKQLSEPHVVTLARLCGKRSDVGIHGCFYFPSTARILSQTASDVQSSWGRYGLPLDARLFLEYARICSRHVYWAKASPLRSLCLSTAT